MMKPFLVVALGLLLVACPQPEIHVQAYDEDADGERVPLADLPVRFLPFDRDEIFDSLAAAAAEPEPELPSAVMERQEEVRDAEQEWRAAETAWTERRARLRQLAREMEEMEDQGLRGTPQYQQRFREFEQREDEVVSLRREMDERFGRFTQLQEEVFAETEAHRARQEAWEDRAFADYNQVIQDRLDRERREIVEDTTDASGRLRVRVPTGRWWVHARYQQPYTELYWNLPVQLESRGDSVEVILTRETAEERIRL